MKCPRCNLPLPVQDYKHVSVHHCDGCQGFWLNGTQLKQILDLSEHLFSPELVQKTLTQAHAGIPPAEQNICLSCPECSREMGARNYNYSSGVIVNICADGHGIWFDKNELEAVEIFIEHWNLEESTHEREWTEKMDKARAEEESTIQQIDTKIREEISPSGFLSIVFNAFDKMKLKK